MDLNIDDHFFAVFFSAFFSAGFLPATGRTFNSLPSYISWWGYPLAQHHDLEPLEVGELSPASSVGDGLAGGTLRPLLGEALLTDDLADDAAAGSSSDGHLELGELQPPHGDDLALDVLTINEDSVLVDDVDDDGKVAFLLAVVDACDSSHLNELGEGLR